MSLVITMRDSRSSAVFFSLNQSGFSDAQLPRESAGFCADCDDTKEEEGPQNKLYRSAKFPARKSRLFRAITRQVERDTTFVCWAQIANEQLPVIVTLGFLVASVSTPPVAFGVIVALVCKRAELVLPFGNLLETQATTGNPSFYANFAGFTNTRQSL